MIKKYMLVILVTLSFIASIGIVSGEPIGSFEIMDFALPYAFNNEIISADGPYDYANNSYYLVHFGGENGLAGELVLDANTGEIVRDENISKKVIFAFVVFDSSYTMINDMFFVSSLQDYKELSSRGYEFYTTISGNEYIESSDADKLKSGAYIYMDLELQYSNLLSADDEVSNISSRLYLTN